MIDVKELRIGNWVQDEGKLYSIDEISQDDKWEHIPLTPEILEKFGFEMPSMTKCINNDWILYKDQRDGKVYLQTEKQGSEEYICERIELPIKHLHQLQNFYYDLTGEELKINSPSFSSPQL